jgi:hypothetical protein
MTQMDADKVGTNNPSVRLRHHASITLPAIAIVLWFVVFYNFYYGQSADNNNFRKVQEHSGIF